jgi:hypothetical protein
MRGRLIGITLAAIGFAAWPARASAEWQVKPFIGISFAPSTTIADPDQGVGGVNRTLGVSALVLGEVFGVEGEVSRLSNLFKGQPVAVDPVTGQVTELDPVVTGSLVTTATVNAVLAMPRRIAEYGLRPYAVVGGGLIRVHNTTTLNLLDVTDNMLGFDFGGGVTGFFNRHVGVNWEVRRFSTVGGYSLDLAFLQTDDTTGQLLDQKLSFWRATFAVAIR